MPNHFKRCLDKAPLQGEHPWALNRAQIKLGLHLSSSRCEKKTTEETKPALFLIILPPNLYHLAPKEAPMATHQPLFQDKQLLARHGCSQRAADGSR